MKNKSAIHTAAVLLMSVIIASVGFGAAGHLTITSFADTDIYSFDQDISMTSSNEYVLVQAPGVTTSHQYTVQENVTGVTLELKPSSGSLVMDASGTEHSCIYLKKGSEATVIINGEVNMKAGHHRGSGADTGYAAIAVNSGATLNLIVNGKLTAYGGDGGENRGAAAIGGGDEADSGTMNITVNDGGELYCEGADGAAAIGGGDEYSNVRPVSITTNGSGKLTAKATSRGSGGGAGIGGGDGGSANNTINITMNGSSTIYAEGISGGAGIGGGDGNGGGAITIDMKSSDATLTAVGGNGGAGIGGGSGGGTKDISISGWGRIDATGGFAAAAIGGGDSGSCGKITIKGDAGHQSVTAADIKNGTFDNRNFALSINASASQEDKDVGSYYAPNIGGKGTGDISIENADIYCVYPRYAAMYAASVGCGYEGSVKNITIRSSRLKQNSLSYGSYNCFGAMVGEGHSGDVDTITMDTVYCYGRSIGGSAWNGGNIDSITISNSYVYADAPDTAYIKDSDKLKYSYPVAGIGSGKDASLNSVTITDSEIQAYGKGGGAGIGTGGFYVGGTNIDNIFKKDGKCGSITISGSTVTARGANGGAGIGGGSCTTVKGTISIENSTVTASAVNSDYNNASGAGIGGGTCASCGAISISGSKVTAKTDRFSAGIGSGGISDENFFGGIVDSAWDPEIGNIDITGRSEVTATGGENGAGIGNGWGSQQESGKHLNITDSTVTATGGKYAAGIGGGNNGEFDRGGDFGSISITGKSRVEAKGGEEGAGIGGGSQGELNGCTIELDEDLSYGESGQLEPLYYVKAWGGTAAAGIGSGPSHAADMSGVFEGAHQAQNIKIKSGFVYAMGGGDKKLSNINGDYWIGAGAGIGGGGRGALNSFEMSGGVVAAEHQSSTVQKGLEDQTRQASDIGHGGGYAPWAYSNTDCSGIEISGGTVDSGICDECTIKVTGGSLRDARGGDHPSDPKAKNEDGTKVFKNTVNIDPDSMLGSPVTFAGHTYYGVSVKDVSSSYYGTKGIYAKKVSDTRAAVWPHLPAGAENASHATISSGGTDYYYYGTTKDGDNTNTLKMGEELVLRPETEGARPAAGSTIRLILSTKNTLMEFPEAEFSFSVSGSSSPEIREQQAAVTTTDDGPVYPYVVVYTAQEGDLTVTADSGQTESDMYWKQSAKYSDTVGAPRVRVTLNRDLSKVYDGEIAWLSNFAEDNDISVDPEQARGDNGTNISQLYYMAGVTAPLDNNDAREPGDYYVTVTVADADSPDGSITIDGVEYSPGYARQDFTISKYTQEFKVTSPQRVVIVPEGGEVRIVPEYTLEITDKDAQGKTLEPPYGKTYIDPEGGRDDGGEVTVTYVRLDSGDRTPSKEAPTVPGRYKMILTAKETDHYKQTVASVYFRIIKCPPTELTVDAGDKVYDGEPVSDPELTCNRDTDDIEFTYYSSDGNGGWTKLTGEPSAAGDYKVEAYLPANEYYQEAKAEDEFSISPRNVLLDADSSRSYDNGQPTDGAAVRINVINGLPELEGKKVMIAVKPESGAAVMREAALAVSSDTGRLYAETDFADVGAGTYTVTAGMAEDPVNANYNFINRSESFTKLSRTYTVTAEDHTAELYDGPFSLDVDVTDPQGPTLKYSCSYQIIDPASGDPVSGNAGNAVRVVGGNGLHASEEGQDAGGDRLEVTGAGQDIVRVVITPDPDDDNVHSVSEGYAVVTVNKGIVYLEVSASDRTYNGKPDEAKAGLSYGGKKYPVKYDSDKIRLDYFETQPDGLMIRIDEAVDAGSYLAMASAPDDDNFKVRGDRAAYSITPAGIKVTTGSGSKVYDGYPLTNSQAVITGLVNGEKALIRATGSQTDIGTSDNTYEIIWAEDDPQELTAKAQNYTVAEKDLGKLTVTDPSEDKRDGGGESGGSNGGGGGSGRAKTGDDSGIILWSIMGALSGAMLLLLIGIRRKYGKE